METALVTGGAGFIGSHIVDELINKGLKVLVLDDLSGGYTENINSSAIFINGSITNHELISKIFNDHKIDYVYHLAAYAAEGLSHFIKRFNYTNNLIGSVNLINESIKHKIKCFVFTSSIAVYGKNQLPMSEDMVPMPEDPYGIAKYAVEQELKVSHEMFGLNYVIFRPHNVYGERQNIGDRYRNVVGIFINQIMQEKPLTVFGDGEQSRAFTYIGDIASVIATSAFRPELYQDVFNLGSDDVSTVNKLAKTVLRLMDKNMEIRYLPGRNEVIHAFSDHSKIKNAFPEMENTSLEKGVERMITWALKTGSRKTPVFKDIEIHEKLPAIWSEK